MLMRMPATPRALGFSLRVTYPRTTRTSKLTFQRAVTMEMGESLSALDSAITEMIWQTAKRKHTQTKPGLTTGTPCQRTKRAAKGRRNVKRPHTAMYSSSSWPRRFITVLRSTWHSAAVSARTCHMRPSLHEHSGIAGGIRGEAGEERSGARHAEMANRDLGEELTEIRGHGEIAPFVELLARKARPLPHHASALHRAAQDEHGRGMSVVGAPVAVLAHGAAELRHGQHDHVAHALPQVAIEGGQVLGELGETEGELPALVALVGVRVPAPHVGEGDLEPDVGLDELGNLSQAVAKPTPRILRAVLGREALRIGGLEQLHRVEGLAARAVEDVAHALLVQRLEAPPRVDPARSRSPHFLFHVEVRHRPHGHRADVSSESPGKLRPHGHRAEGPGTVDGHGLQPAREPAVRRGLHPGRARLHVVLGVEVRTRGVGRAAGVDDGESPILPERLERAHGGMQPEEPVEV